MLFVMFNVKKKATTSRIIIRNSKRIMIVITVKLKPVNYCKPKNNAEMKNILIVNGVFSVL